MLLSKAVRAVMSFRCPPELLLRSAIRSSTQIPQIQAKRLAATYGSTFKAAMCKELGKPLQIETMPSITELSQGEVCIAVRNCGINFSDILMTQGLYQEKPPLPFVPGSEVAGEVVAVGPGVDEIQPGDRVVGLIMMGGGGYAEQCVTSQDHVWKIPGNLSFEEAASMLISYGTAMMALERKADLQQGETVLITAAAGAVGLAAVDIARNIYGCRVIAACSGEEKGKVAKEKGANFVVDYKKESLKDAVSEITNGKGCHVVFDAVGGDTFKQCLRSVAFEGRILTIGYASGDIPRIPANVLLLKSCSVIGVYWGSYSYMHPPAFRESIMKVLDEVTFKKIRPYTNRTFPLSQVNEAFKFIQSRQSIGKVVLDCVAT